MGTSAPSPLVPQERARMSQTLCVQASTQAPKWGGLGLFSGCRAAGVPMLGPRTGYKSARVRTGQSPVVEGPELPRQPLFGGESLNGTVLEWKAGGRIVSF